MHERFLSACGGSIESHTKEQKLAAQIKREDPLKATLALLQKGRSVEEIAQARERKPSTIITHLEKLRTEKKITHADVAHLLRGREDEMESVFTAFEKMGTERLAPILSKLSGNVSYDTLHLARVLFLLQN